MRVGTLNAEVGAGGAGGGLPGSPSALSSLRKALTVQGGRRKVLLKHQIHRHPGGKQDTPPRRLWSAITIGSMSNPGSILALEEGHTLPGDRRAREGKKQSQLPGECFWLGPPVLAYRAQRGLQTPSSSLQPYSSRLPREILV